MCNKNFKQYLMVNFQLPHNFPVGAIFEITESKIQSDQIQIKHFIGCD